MKVYNTFGSFRAAICASRMSAMASPFPHQVESWINPKYASGCLNTDRHAEIIPGKVQASETKYIGGQYKHLSQCHGQTRIVRLAYTFQQRPLTGCWPLPARTHAHAQTPAVSSEISAVTSESWQATNLVPCKPSQRHWADNVWVYHRVVQRGIHFPRLTRLQSFGCCPVFNLRCHLGTQPMEKHTGLRAPDVHLLEFRLENTKKTVELAECTASMKSEKVTAQASTRRDGRTPIVADQPNGHFAFKPVKDLPAKDPAHLRESPSASAPEQGDGSPGACTHR